MERGEDGRFDLVRTGDFPARLRTSRGTFRCSAQAVRPSGLAYMLVRKPASDRPSYQRIMKRRRSSVRCQRLISQ